jgi:hypothetical protein
MNNKKLQAKNLDVLPGGQYTDLLNKTPVLTAEHIN